MRTSQVTTEHAEIRRWVEERQGHPATVRRPGQKPDEVGILRIDFPKYGGKGSLQHISWEQFFRKFEDKNLAFVYEERTSSGQLSHFSKFISRDRLAPSPALPVAGTAASSDQRAA
jgi:hypothetical protein